METTKGGGEIRNIRTLSKQGMKIMEGCNRSGKEIVSKRIAASIQNY